MEWFEIVIVWLGTLLAAMMVLNGWITGKSIEAVRSSIPKEAMGLLELLLVGGLQLSRLTETKADDMALERVARILGYEIETTSGGLLLKRTPTMGEADSAMYKDSTGAQGRADPPVMEAARSGAKLTDLQEIPKAQL